MVKIFADDTGADELQLRLHSSVRGATAVQNMSLVEVVPHIAMSRALVRWHGWLTQRVVSRARRQLVS